MTKPPTVPPAMAAICELVGLELTGVAGEVDAPGVVAPGVVNCPKLVDSLEGVDVMILELDESYDGFEVFDDVGEVDVMVFALDEPIRLVDMEGLSVEEALDEEDDDNEVEAPMTLKKPE